MAKALLGPVIIAPVMTKKALAGLFSEYLLRVKSSAPLDWRGIEHRSGCTTPLPKR
ncbi:hypothetical protein [Bradyrhizobium sp. STM 3557]|uniref:hypothetical protein n=1 Tax=Bradyrhizobium sp. STM 3557 TaxID=578920 RepID=UPI0038908079